MAKFFVPYVTLCLFIVCWLVSLSVGEELASGENACEDDQSGTCGRAPDDTSDTAQSKLSALSCRFRSYRASDASAAPYGGTHSTDVFKREGFEAVQTNDWDVFWSHRQEEKELERVKLQPREGRQRLVNHCGYFKGAGQKCHFAGHINRVQAALSGDPKRTARFTYLRNFVLTHEDQWRAWGKEVHANPETTWVYKVCASGMSEGVEILRGETLLARVDGVKPKIWSVAQEYLHNPFMGFGERKFHLRVYVLITSWTPSPRVFVFNEGVVFRSRHAYDPNVLSNKRDVFSAISADVEALPHAALWSAIDKLGSRGQLPSSADIRLHMLDVIRDIFGEATEQSNGKAADFAAKLAGKSYSCFELFGLDVMFNDRLEPFVLEVNEGPNLNIDDRGEEASGLLQNVKGPLMQQLARWVAQRVTSNGQNEREIEDRTLTNFTRLL